MDLSPGEAVLFRGHPSWRSIMGFYIKGLVLAALVGAIVGFAASPATGALIAFLVLLAVIVIGLIRREATTYVISNERLHIKRGIVSRHTQETRIDRVQNVNTTQSVIERLLRVGTVDFDTAGTDDSDFAFHGIANPANVVQVVDRAQREPPLQASPSSAPAPPEPEPPPEGS